MGEVEVLAPGRGGAESFSWQTAAACRNVDPALFFHPDGERGRARERRQLTAKEICGECPVIYQCLEHAVTFQEPFGTWGGLTEEERGKLLSRRAVNIRTHGRSASGG
ncbi:WhiB family transcriptional regulator [Mycobacteriaceae bacterium Msp059]|nr:WhiB family transcriptional regulator [Mycobacteriaceae bacterium Msp059]